MATLTAYFNAQDRMTRSLQRMTTSSQRLARLINNDLNRAVENVNRRFDNMFDVAQDAGKKISAMGLAMGVGLGAAVKVTADFEASMSRVSALSGATDSQLDVLTKTAKTLGASTSFSASQAAEGMQYLAMAGFETNEIVASMPGLLGAAAAGHTDLGSAADIVSNILSGFSMKASMTSKVSDVMSKAFTSSNVELYDLGETMKYVAPIASGVGYSIEEMTAATGILGDSSIKGSEAGTALRTMILRLVDPPKEAADALSGLGVKTIDASGKMLPFADILEQIQKGTEGMTEAQKASMAANIAGTEATSALMVLLNQGPEKLKQFTKELENSGGTAEKIAEEQLDNLNGSITKLMSALEGAAIAIGEHLTPSIKVITEFANSVVDKFNALPAPVKKFLAIGGALAAALALIAGPMLLLIGFIPSISAGFGMLAMIATPMLSIVAVGAAVIAGLVGVALVIKNLWQTNKEFRDKMIGIWEKIKGLTTTVGDFYKTIKDKFESAKTKMIEAVELIMGKIDAFEQMLIDHQSTIKITAGILTTIFGPALIITGVKAMIAGAQIAGSFIASMATAGAQAIVSAAQVTASFVASMITTGAQAVIAGARVTGSFVLSLLRAAAQATITGVTITSSLVASLASYALQGWRTVGVIAAQSLAWAAQKGTLLISAGATWAMTAAQWALNAAFWANPLTWVVAGVMALIGAGVLLYKNWDKIKASVGDLWDGIKETFKTGVNSVIKYINKMIDGINGLSFKAPDWVPIIGGKGWSPNIPNIPEYAAGGIINRPHVGLVGEAGPEAIIPLSASRRNGALKLWEQAGRMMGVMPHADGGIFGKIKGFFGNNTVQNIGGNAEMAAIGLESSRRGYDKTLNSVYANYEKKMAKVNSIADAYKIRDIGHKTKNLTKGFGNITKLFSRAALPLAIFEGATEIIAAEDKKRAFVKEIGATIGAIGAGALAGAGTGALVGAGVLSPATAMIGAIIGAGAGAFGGQALADMLYDRISKFATGTNFAPGGLSLVGEQGPELVDVPRGSRVLSNKETQAILGGVSGRNQVVNKRVTFDNLIGNVTVQNEADEDRLVAKIKRLLERELEEELLAGGGVYGL